MNFRFNPNLVPDDSMNIGLIIYYIFSLALGIIVLSGLVYYYHRKKERVYLYLIALYLSFMMMIVYLNAGLIFSMSGWWDTFAPVGEWDKGWIVFVIIGSLFSSSFIMTLPLFVNEFYSVRRKKTANRVFSALFAMNIVLITLSLVRNVDTAILSMICIGASILYAVMMSRIRSRNVIFPGAIKINRGILIVTLIFLPFIVTRDLLNLDFWNNILPQYFFFTAAFFLVTNLIIIRFFIRFSYQAFHSNVVLQDREVLKRNYGLSARETEIAQLLIIEGLSYKDISSRLFISMPTVKSHINHIYRKTNCKNRNELLQLFRKI